MVVKKKKGMKNRKDFLVGVVSCGMISFVHSSVVVLVTACNLRRCVLGGRCGCVDCC